MGIADIDFKAAPSITKAINDRVKHENWGYLDMGVWTPKVTEAVAAWNKRRYGVTIDPTTMLISAGVHPALIAALKTFSPPGSKVLLQTPTYNGFYSRPARVADHRRREPDEVRQRQVPDGLRRLRAPHQPSTPTRSSSATRRTRPATAGRRRTCCASARSA